MTFRCEPLGAQDLTNFECGNDELSTWLIRHSQTATGHGTRTTVVIDDETGRLSGYFSIAPHLLEREALPRSVARGAPREIPAVLLVKLALSHELHGTGLGAELLVAALREIVRAARVAGGKLVVVDAIDEAAAAFYEHHDFQRVPGQADRLVMKLSSAARALGEPWP